ncbi:uncharacterized [Tachysurus ichikawai]
MLVLAVLAHLARDSPDVDGTRWKTKTLGFLVDLRLKAPPQESPACFKRPHRNGLGANHPHTCTRDDAMLFQNACVNALPLDQVITTTDPASDLFFVYM